MIDASPSLAPDSAPIEPPAATAPRLWNPNAAASWSLIFSPVFGALLQRSNWLAMGHPDKAARSLQWVWAYLVFLVVTVGVSAVLPSEKAADLLTRVAGLVFLVVWYYANGKEQVGLVLARYGRTYPRKSWLKPIGLALLVAIAFVMLGALLAMAEGLPHE